MTQTTITKADSGTLGIADARRLFPGTRDGIFMDVASRGLIPTATRDAVAGILESRLAGTTDKEALFETVERVRMLYAKLINATEDEIAFIKNVSDGINSIAAAVDWKSGDNVVVCPSLEHPTNIYPWVNQKRLRGIDIRIVDDDSGHMPVDRMIAAMDDRTRVVSASLVSFSPGFKTDVEKLGNACRNAGAIFVVDGAQGIGIVHLDMRRMPIDALSVSTQKGLCSFYGLGFLYVRRDLAETMQPSYLSRFGVDIGDSHEAAGDIENYDLMRGARRFEVGNYNYLGAIAVEPSLNILRRIGTEAIERHVRGLAHDLVGKLLDLGLPVYGGEPGPHIVHIVALGNGIEPTHDVHDNSDIASFARVLQASGVRLAVRRGMIRLSLHVYNNHEDVDRFIDIARGWNRSRGNG